MAFFDREPKLIPEMFTTLAGRNAWRRPRGPPSTLADGRDTSSPACRAVGAPSPLNVRCLRIG